MPLPGRQVFFEPRSILSDGVVSVKKAGAISVEHEATFIHHTFIAAGPRRTRAQRKKNISRVHFPRLYGFTTQVIMAATTQDSNKV